MHELVAQRVKPVRACFLVGLPKSSWHYQAKPRQDDKLRNRIRELAGQHPRRGSRFIHALLVKEGNKVNRKKVRRIWQEEQLTIKKNPSRNIRTSNTIPMSAQYPNHVWTYDFIFDQTLGGTTLKLLTLTDEFTRHWIAVLDEVIKERGAPTFLRSDNGLEFIARDLGIWLAMQEISTRFIEPGKPWQNGFAESFHARLREECLS
ncbi:transposase [Deinococcus sp. Arct2-2]|nr:transposase [Deinococcus sp. Arct2-2]